MDIKNYLKSLVPTLGKDKILDDQRVTLENLQNTVQPLYQQAAIASKTVTFTNAKVSRMSEVARERLKGARTDNVLVILERHLPNVIANVQWLNTQIEQLFTDEVATGSLSLKNANILQLMEYSSFLDRYMRKLVDFVFVHELDSTPMYKNYAKDNLSKGQMEMIEKRYQYFIEVFDIFRQKPDDFQKRLNQIPEITLDVDNTTAALGIFDKAKTDPFRLNYIPVLSAPFYRIGMWLAEWQTMRYREAKDDLRKVQLRIKLLEQAQQNEPNPAIERELQYQQDRAEQLSYKIDKAESKL